MPTQHVLSIDIGMHHLGMVLASFDEYQLDEILYIDLIDITSFVHLDEEAKRNCKLYHTKTCSDYMDHVFYLHHHLFEFVDVILIERQPPQGLVVIEQLIFHQYRSKAILISPTSMHAFFNWNSFAARSSTDAKADAADARYEYRKGRSIREATKHITRDELMDQFDQFTRQHDISDAICMIVFWLRTKRVQYEKALKMNNHSIDGTTCVLEVLDIYYNEDVEAES
jgi:hypothetical protein